MSDKLYPLEIPRTISMDELPWETPPAVQKTDVEMGEKHFVRNGKLGAMVLCSSNYAALGSRIYIFTDDQTSFDSLKKMIDAKEQDDIRFTSLNAQAGFSITSGIPIYDQDGKKYKISQGYVLGGPVPNYFLRESLLRFEKMGVLPKGLETYLPDNS